MNTKRLRTSTLVCVLLLVALLAVGCQGSGADEPAVNDPATITQIAANNLSTQAAAVTPDTPTSTVDARATERAAIRATDDAEATAHHLSFEATADRYTASAMTAVAQETADSATRLAVQQTTADARSFNLTATAAYKQEAQDALAAAYEGPIDSLVRAADSYKDLVYGPEDGSMAHLDQYVAVADPTRRRFYNFVVEVAFYNPYSLTESGWDYGVLFRDYDRNDQFRLVVFSNGQWELRNHEGDDAPRLQAGAVPNFDNSAGGANSVRLVCYRDRGAVYINGQFAAELNLSARERPGNLMLGTGLYYGNHIAGRTTRYEGFSIWSLPQ